jgi:hypothetical protein
MCADAHYATGWVIRIDGADSATTLELRDELLRVARGRAAAATDTLIETIEIQWPYIRNDSAVVSVDQATVWCANGSLARAGVKYDYRLFRSRDGWHFLRREGGWFYDPPLHLGTPVVRKCVPAP